MSGGSDVNGDGDADPIVGAPNNDAGGLGAGRAYRSSWLQRPDVTVDGSADASYGAPLVTQSLQTSFGNSTTGVVDFANGSELDQAFARLTPRALCLLLAGNLEANFKKLAIFLDTKLGEGQNRLRGDNPNIDGNSLNRMGDDGSGNGMRFDSDFAPDYYLTVTGGNTGGGHYEILVKWAELRTNGGGLGRFLGRTDAVSNGVLVTGDNPFDVRVTINNSNTAGVTAGTLGGSGAGVTSGHRTVDSGAGDRLPDRDGTRRGVRQRQLRRPRLESGAREPADRNHEPRRPALRRLRRHPRPPVLLGAPRGPGERAATGCGRRPRGASRRIRSRRGRRSRSR